MASSFFTESSYTRGKSRSSDLDAPDCGLPGLFQWPIANLLRVITAAATVREFHPASQIADAPTILFVYQSYHVCRLIASSFRFLKINRNRRCSLLNSNNHTSLHIADGRIAHQRIYNKTIIGFYILGHDF